MNRLVTAASALAIALTSLTATPAAAQTAPDRDTLTMLLGLAAVGYLAHEADKDRKDDKDDKKRFSSKNYQDQRHYDWRYDDRRYDDDDWHDDDRRHDNRRHDNRGNQRVDRRKLIPGQCVIEARANGRWTNVVSEQCYRRARGENLPNACAFDIRTDRGRKEVFGTNCLKDRGFRISR